MFAIYVYMYMYLIKKCIYVNYLKLKTRILEIINNNYKIKVS